MRSLWAMVTLILGILCLVFFVFTEARGQVLGSPRERFVPADMRGASGSARSFHFWHSGSGGYRGGK